MDWTRRRRISYFGYEIVPNVLGVGCVVLPMGVVMLFALMMSFDDPAALLCVGANLGVILLCLSFLRRGVIEVAGDGVAFTGRRPSGLPAFVPWTEVSRVRPAGYVAGNHGPVWIELLDGRRFRVPRVERPSILVRVWDAAHEALAGHEPVDVPLALTQPRDTSQYREGATTPEQLLRIAEAPALDAKIRVEAVERAHAAGQREALEALAERTAEPRVRRRLEKLLRRRAQDASVRSQSTTASAKPGSR